MDDDRRPGSVAAEAAVTHEPASVTGGGRQALLRSLGPGVIVTAAFIGPGTVTTATLAGGRFGYALLWAVLFSIIATIVLQEMAARLGLVTEIGRAHV